MPARPDLRPHLIPATAALVAFCLGLTIGQACQPPTPDSRAWDQRVRGLLEDSTRVQQGVVRLVDAAQLQQARADSLTQVAARWEGAALTHRQRATVALAALQTAQTPSDSIPPLLAALGASQDETQAWRTAFMTAQLSMGRLREAVTLHRARGDTLQIRVFALEDALRDRPTARPCRIVGFLPCPGRGTVAVVAFVAGMAATVAVLK
jgi:hypothetical protein